MESNNIIFGSIAAVGIILYYAFKMLWWKNKFLYSRLSNKHSAEIINLSIFTRDKKEFDIPKNKQGKLC